MSMCSATKSFADVIRKSHDLKELELSYNCTLFVVLQNCSRRGHSPDSILSFPLSPKFASSSEPHVEVVNSQEDHYSTKSINSGKHCSCFRLFGLD